MNKRVDFISSCKQFVKDALRFLTFSHAAYMMNSYKRSIHDFSLLLTFSIFPPLLSKHKMRKSGQSQDCPDFFSLFFSKNLNHSLCKEAGGQRRLLRGVSCRSYLHQEASGGGMLIVSGVAQQDRAHELLVL